MGYSQVIHSPCERARERRGAPFFWRTLLLMVLQQSRRQSIRGPIEGGVGNIAPGAGAIFLLVRFQSNGGTIGSSQGLRLEVTVQARAQLIVRHQIAMLDAALSLLHGIVVGMPVHHFFIASSVGVLYLNNRCNYCRRGC